MRHLTAAAAVLAACLVAGTAGASSLRVAPTGLNLPAGNAASSVRVWNNDREPISVQVRVFKATMVGGKERLEPTRDVVASPPMTQLRPGTENLVRVVRVSDRPVQAQERYRLLVDELPDPSRMKAGTVNVLVRHSIPVVFEGR
ncbi:fimbrial biogenesis chaperone [Aureimonas populi]|uniref:Molecular chaperone n=1 Tax=Aureimonas populi TaxID=1701758 RepID=A0ABW5CRF1_9HYPH|nr:fimbria/pilus periplasmic chaperone [Aureimonas populi]